MTEALLVIVIILLVINAILSVRCADANSKVASVLEDINDSIVTHANNYVQVYKDFKSRMR